ncbi:response regulator [Mesorhizobium sp. M0134]|uniref:response regulator transcription factor n=1 Tax=Mesorhizobium sp. M0134 TaxID=2956889 RepID=UPI00333BBA2B
MSEARRTPVQLRNIDPPSIIANVKKQKEATMRAPLIACVDDDASVREALQGFLLAFNFEVVTFASAESFLASNSIDSVSCLITDVRLGGMSGLQLQKSLIARGRLIPTIVITAFSENGFRESAMENGAIAMLLKPITANELLAAVNTALHRGKA